MSDHCAVCGAMTKRNPLRTVRRNMFFLYAVRRRLCLPRHYLIAENYRRFWRLNAI